MLLEVLRESLLRCLPCPGWLPAVPRVLWRGCIPVSCLPLGVASSWDSVGMLSLCFPSSGPRSLDLGLTLNPGEAHPKMILHEITFAETLFPKQVILTSCQV